MNILAAIQRIFGFQDWKEASALPGWRARRTHMRHSRTPFSSSRVAPQYANHMLVEEFADKDARNRRFQQLRSRGTPHLNKFSTIRDKQSVWCVVRPA